MTSLHSVLGMLLLAGLMLACSAYCFGLFRRPGETRRRGRRMAWPLVLAAALPGAVLAQAPRAAGQDQGRGAGVGPETGCESRPAGSPEACHADPARARPRF